VTATLDPQLVHGACVGHPYCPPSTWDSEVHGETDLERADRLRLAVAVCSRCPVADACLDERNRGIGGGVRAGKPYADAVRNMSRHSRGRLPRPACGQPGGRAAHLRRDEDVCDPCATAWRDWNRDRVAAQRETTRAAS